MRFFDFIKIIKKRKQDYTEAITDGKPETPQSVEYLFDLDMLDETTKHNVEYMVQKEMEYAGRGKYFLLYAWRTAYDKTYCVFARMQREEFSIFANVLENQIIRSGRPNFFTIDEFYSFDEKEFFFKSYNLRKDAVITEEIKTHIWEAMMRMFPNYASNKTSRTTIFEKYFPSSLGKFFGAENFLNSGMLYKMLQPITPKENGAFEIQCWQVTNQGAEDETSDLVDLHFSSPKTEEEFLSYVQQLFSKSTATALSSIPHRTIYIDYRDSIGCGSMFFKADYRELHIYQSRTATSIIVLKTYSVYNGGPREGGRMEGYSFEKTIEIPAEQYYWSDIKLITEYKQHFK